MYREIFNKSRRVGLTRIACESMLPTLNDGKKVFLAGTTFPEQVISILKLLGVDVSVEEAYNNPQPERIYDNVFAIEPNIIGFIYSDKELIGYNIIKK